MPRSASRRRRSDSSPDSASPRAMSRTRRSRGRERRADGDPVRGADEAEPPCRLVGGEEGLAAEASRGLHERVGDWHHAERRPTGAVMVGAATAGVRMGAPFVAEPDVQPGVGEHPDAPEGERRDAGDRAAVRGGSHDGGRGPTERIHAMAHPDHQAVPRRSGEGGAGHALAEDLPRLRDAAPSLEGLHHASAHPAHPGDTPLDPRWRRRIPCDVRASRVPVQEAAATDVPARPSGPARRAATKAQERVGLMGRPRRHAPQASRSILRFAPPRPRSGRFAPPRRGQRPVRARRAASPGGTRRSAPTRSL